MVEFFIKFLADWLVIVVIALGAFALLKYPRAKKLEAYSRVLMAGLTSYLFAKLIASVYQPESERPFQQLGVDAGASYLNNPGFPSDHVLFCAAITLAVAFEVRKKWLTVTMVLLTILVALGRVIALVHTPLDVSGGLLIAMIGIGWYIQRPDKMTKSRIRILRKNTIR